MGQLDQSISPSMDQWTTSMTKALSRLRRWSQPQPLVADRVLWPGQAVNGSVLWGLKWNSWGGGSMRIPRGHLKLVMSQFNVRLYVSTPWRMELLGEFNQIPGLSDSNHIMTSWRICQQLLLSVDFNSTESLRIQSPSEKGKGTYIYLAEVFGRPNRLTIWLDASKKWQFEVRFNLDSAWNHETLLQWCTSLASISFFPPPAVATLKRPRNRNPKGQRDGLQ